MKYICISIIQFLMETTVLRQRSTTACENLHPVLVALKNALRVCCFFRRKHKLNTNLQHTCVGYFFTNECQKAIVEVRQHRQSESNTAAFICQYGRHFMIYSIYIEGNLKKKHLASNTTIVWLLLLYLRIVKFKLRRINC